MRHKVNFAYEKSHKGFSVKNFRGSFGSENESISVQFSDFGGSSSLIQGFFGEVVLRSIFRRKDQQYNNIPVL